MPAIKTTFGKASQERLNTVDDRLVKVCWRALELANLAGRDFSIIEGWRSLETQMQLFKDNKSKLREGKHNLKPSQAIDFVPWHPKHKALTGHDDQIAKIADENKIAVYAARYKVMAEFFIIAQFFFVAAEELGVSIRWGGDWNMNNDCFDNTFDDVGHIELC